MSKKLLHFTDTAGLLIDCVLHMSTEPHILRNGSKHYSYLPASPCDYIYILKSHQHVKPNYTVVNNGGNE